METTLTTTTTTTLTPLGTIRRFCHTIRISCAPEEGTTRRFDLAVAYADGPADLGTITLTLGAAAVIDWTSEAAEIDLLPGSRFETGIVDTLKGLVDALDHHAILAAHHGFKTAADCPVPIAVEDAQAWWDR